MYPRRISPVFSALALLLVVDLRYSTSKGKFSLSHTLYSVLFLAKASKSLTPLLCDGGLCSVRVKIVVVSEVPVLCLVIPRERYVVL